MIRKIIVIAVICMSAQLAVAQVEQGDKVLGANLSVTSQTVAESTFTSLFLAVSAEKYVTDNISLGIAPTIVANFSDLSDSGAVGFSLFGSYSFLTDEGKFLPYVGAQYSFLSIIDSESDEPPSFGSLGGNVGMKIFMTELVSVDTKLSYTAYIHSSLGEVPSGGLLLLNIGFSIIIPD